MSLGSSIVPRACHVSLSQDQVRFTTTEHGVTEYMYWPPIMTLFLLEVFRYYLAVTARSHSKHIIHHTLGIPPSL